MATQYQYQYQQEQTRKHFTVDEYHKMGEAGILSEDDRLELIDGEIVQMSPINVPHQSCVDRLTMLFAPRLVGRGIVRVQGPILLDMENEPQPDVILLRQSDYAERQYHPQPEDILLVIEVADSTLRTDRRDKMPRYARAGISEAWIVNIPKKVVEIYSDPVDGKYTSVQRVGRGHTITPKALPDVTVQVDDFLGASL